MAGDTGDDSHQTKIEDETENLDIASQHRATRSSSTMTDNLRDTWSLLFGEAHAPAAFPKGALSFGSSTLSCERAETVPCDP